MVKCTGKGKEIPDKLLCLLSQECLINKDISSSGPLSAFGSKCFPFKTYLQTRKKIKKALCCHNALNPLILLFMIIIK